MTNNNNIKPKLGDIKKTNPFVVPDNYFETLPMQVANKISESVNRKQALPVLGYLKPKLIPIIVVTGIALLLVTTFIIRPFNKEKVFTNSELAEIYQFSAINESNESDLIKELARISEQNSLSSDSLKTIKNDYTNAAIDYLNDENIDISTVIDAL